jgi:basic membrane protein A
MNKFKLTSLVVLVVVMLAFAGCAPIATPAPAPTAAPQAAAPTTAPAPAAAKALKIGLVTDVGKIDDRGFLQASWEAVQQAEKDLGAEVKYIQTTDAKDFEKNLAQFAEGGYDVVVVSGFGPTDATAAAAKKYPDVKFVAIGQFHADYPPNLVNINFPEDQAGFLGGALAAQMTKSGILGSVQATDAVPAVWRYGEGFRAGAKYIKPDTQINVVYHSDVGFDKTFNDPEWGKTTAASMIDKGADVIFAGASDTGNGALLGAAQKGAMAIGMDVDAYEAVPEAKAAMLSSGMKEIKSGTFGLLKGIAEGNFKNGDVMGGVALAPYHDYDSKVPAEVKAKMQEILKGLQDGSIKTGVPPTKPAQ